MRHFFPIFSHWLNDELGEAKIFVDQRMETGMKWPVKLVRSLATSRVIVPLFSQNYFTSDWCTAELGHMLAREAACGVGTPDVPLGLIVPAIISDSTNLPREVAEIQAVDLHAYSDPFIAESGITRELLSASVRAWIPDVVNAIEAAPEHDPSWYRLSASAFVPRLKRSADRIVLPKLRMR